MFRKRKIYTFYTIVYYILTVEMKYSHVCNNVYTGISWPWKHVYTINPLLFLFRTGQSGKNFLLRNCWFFKIWKEVLIMDFRNPELSFVQDSISSKQWKVSSGVKKIIHIAGFLIMTRNISFHRNNNSWLQNDWIVAQHFSYAWVFHFSLAYF